MDREALIMENLPLAWHMARRQLRRGTEYSLEELYSQALVGLWDAARTYDPEATQFSTYACACMEHSFQKQYVYDHRQMRNGDTVSLDAKALKNGEGTETRMDRIPDPKKGPEETLMDRERAREIEKALDRLSAREREVIMLRFGLGDQGPPMDWQEIGGMYGVTRQSAQQTGKRAMDKLKQYIVSQRKAGREI